MELIKDALSIVLRQKEGIRLSKENAVNLFNAAELLATNKFYSPAIPILILSAEEMIKSFALCLEFLLGDRSEVKRIIKNGKSKRTDSHLFKHVDKHEFAKIIIQDLKMLSTPAIIELKELLSGKNIYRDKLNMMKSITTGRISFLILVLYIIR